jgi:transcriptional regulator with GAF, ATPase, and Fis domain
VLTLADGRRVLLVMAGAEAQLGGDLERAMAAVIAASFAHVATLARVAALSNRAHRDRELLREQLAEAEPELVCESEVMRRLVRETVPLVAHEDVTVLVRGESGTGKELVVRRIHALSRRARRALVTVNCGALAEGVAESTLFGHEAGAFTGASARHLGIFERAHGGTVFLDEVGELSPSSQARLLRVLSSGEVTRVGGALSHRVDVRVVAATHRPLEAMIADGRFRQDLFFRLNVVPIEVPPLRERREDVAPLARAILAALAARAGRPTPALRGVDLARLVAWSWPGNVRELENVLQRALVLSGEGELALPQGWEGLAPRGGVASSPQDGVAERFDDAVRAILARALEACEGRIHGPSGAAARLGLPPTTLQAKLRKLGVRRASRGG